MTVNPPLSDTAAHSTQRAFQQLDATTHTLKKQYTVITTVFKMIERFHAEIACCSASHVRL